MLPWKPVTPAATMAFGVIVTVGLGAALVVVERTAVIEVVTTVDELAVGIRVHCPTRPSVAEYPSRHT